MASISIAMSPSFATHNRVFRLTSGSFFKPLPLGHLRVLFSAKAKVQASSAGLIEGKGSERKQQNSASSVIPHVAEAADAGVILSLKNFLLSIVAGEVVLGVIVRAVIGVANFDPVKRS
ncbi:hypothetical protein SLE2022_147990 [Rubroshorea leprosula]